MGLAAKVLSDSTVSSVRMLVVMLKGILIIPFITNLLGASSYGIWTTVLSFVGLVASSGALHLHGSLVRFSAADRGNQTYSDVLSLGFILASGIALTIILLGLTIDLSFLFGSFDLNQTYLVTGSSFLIFNNIILQININFFRAYIDIKKYEILQIGRNVTETATLIIIFMLNGTVIKAIFGLVLVGVLLNGIFIIGIFINNEIPRPQSSNFSRYIRYGVPMVPAAASKRLMGSADKYILLYLISPTAVGVYAVAHSICLSLTKFSTVLNPTLYPSVSKAWENGNISNVKNLYASIFRYYSIIAIPAFFGLSYLSYEIITLISTPEIADQAFILVPILSFGFLLRGFDNPLEYILTSAKETDLIAKATIISVAVNVVLNIGLISNYGILGAAVATTVSHVVAFSLVYIYSTKELSFKIPTKTIIKAILSSSLMFLVLVLLPVSLAPLTSILFYPPVGTLIYFTTLYILGEFNQRDIANLAEAVYQR